MTKTINLGYAVLFKGGYNEGYEIFRNFNRLKEAREFMKPKQMVAPYYQKYCIVKLKGEEVK